MQVPRNSIYLYLYMENSTISLFFFISKTKIIKFINSNNINLYNKFYKYKILLKFLNNFDTK